MNVEDLINYSYLWANSQKKYEFFINNFKNLSDKNLLREYFSEKLCQAFWNEIKKNKKNTQKLLSEIENGNVEIVTIFDDIYPEILKKIPDPPVILYVRGKKELFNSEFKIGIVGARNTDFYGKKISEEIAEVLSSKNISIVSGLAFGVDAASHRGALKNSGSTIAVLASSDIYPLRNRKLHEQIVKEGVIISEFPGEYYVGGPMFLARNRIIAGLCQGLVVVRAAKRSGSLSTANYALCYNRDVYAVPGSIFENLSEGTNKLLQCGAIPVLSARDIYLNYGFEDEDNTSVYEDVKLSETEKIIFGFLMQTPLNSDELAEKAELDIFKVISSLSMLELKGLITRSTGGVYYLKKC